MNSLHSLLFAVLLFHSWLAIADNSQMLQEWLPKKLFVGSAQPITRPICNSAENHSQMRVRLLEDTHFFTKNLNKDDVLYGVATFVPKWGNRTLHTIAFCKPGDPNSWDWSERAKGITSCLIDFNGDGLFDDNLEQPIYFYAKEPPPEEYLNSKHQYRYEEIETDAIETSTPCVLVTDKTWQPDDPAPRLIVTKKANEGTEGNSPSQPKDSADTVNTPTPASNSQAFPASVNMDAILAGCKALQNDKEKANCYESAIKLSSQKKESVVQSGQPDQYVALTRAFTAIKANVDIGISYNQYSPLIQNIATELAVLKSQELNEPGKIALVQYQRALEAYNDAAKFWWADIDYFSKSRNRNPLVIATTGGALPLQETGLEWFAKKYNVPTNSVDFWGSPGATRADALRAAWQFAKDCVEKGNVAAGLSGK